MFLSELQEKDIINIKDGRRIGKIIDAEVTPQGQIIYLIIEPKRIFKKILSSNSETKISFEDINKIGEDVILVNL